MFFSKMRYKLNVICVVNVLYGGFLQLCGPASYFVVVDDGARWLAPTSATPLLHTTVRQEESRAEWMTFKTGFFDQKIRANYSELFARII